MGPVKSRAVVLRTYRLGETSSVVVCYTSRYGKVRLVAKGVRKGGGRFGAALEPLMVSGVVFYLRPPRVLSLVSQADVEREYPSLRRDVVRRAYAGAVAELVDLLVPDQEPDRALFDLIEASLSDIAESDPGQLEPLLWRFELELARTLGYAPELSRCVVCGGAAPEGSAFSAELGGAVCVRCAAERGLSDRGVLAVLRAISGGGALESARVPTGIRDDVGRALLELLERHSGRGLALRSISFLSQVRRVGMGDKELPQDGDG